MKKDVIKTLLVILFVMLFMGSIQLWFGLYARTKVSDYDIKAAHYTMDTKYCPYCGEKLDE